MKTFILGLVVTLGAVGGIEQSVAALQLAQCAVVAVVGLALMQVGVSYILEQNNG